MDIEYLITHHVNTNWKDILLELVQPYAKTINKQLTDHYEFFGDENIFPKKENIFRCFNMFDVEQLKCVIIGQDCYHTPNVADGLCFSHSPNKNGKIQKSLENIFKEIHRSLNKKRVNSDLSDWAKQGCLMLNMSLTVISNRANSHSKIWKLFLHDIVKWIANNTSGLCVMLWGNFAKVSGVYFDENKHTVLKSGHPSPLNTKYPFIGCNHFAICEKMCDISF